MSYTCHYHGVSTGNLCAICSTGLITTLRSILVENCRPPFAKHDRMLLRDEHGNWATVIVEDIGSGNEGEEIDVVVRFPGSTRTFVKKAGELHKKGSVRT